MLVLNFLLVVLALALGFLNSCVFVCFIFLKSYFYLILVFLACCASYSFCLSFGFGVLNAQGFGF
ncbi:hypothetical protein HPSNT_05700 [Helicobacter pylori SNT49]|uniref:Uncharacterized protein n=1 Tax=Helicobacter pylori SNT49 TaxID=1055530 RepID=G2MET3_HELPX|nr:hypothetical protein HPSNT_05700 [Helicobacter pylori SNT49]